MGFILSTRDNVCTWGNIVVVCFMAKCFRGLVMQPSSNTFDEFYKRLSGPITIARVAEASVSSGFEDFVRFLAYLSVSLGVLNLLPVPVLDGGHIVYYTIEAIRRKPLSEQAQAFGLRIGMALILTLMVFALYNDLMRL